MRRPITALIAFVLSLCVAFMGALGIVSPARLLGIVRRFQSPTGLYTAAALRLILGVALFLAASTSRAPEVVRVLGLLIFVSGLMTPLFGIERFHKLLDWWSARGPAFMRAWASFALVFGLFLAYALMS